MAFIYSGSILYDSCPSTVIHPVVMYKDTPFTCWYVLVTKTDTDTEVTELTTE